MPFICTHFPTPQMGTHLFVLYAHTHKSLIGRVIAHSYVHVSALTLLVCTRLLDHSSIHETGHHADVYHRNVTLQYNTIPIVKIFCSRSRIDRSIDRSTRKGWCNLQILLLPSDVTSRYLISLFPQQFSMQSSNAVIFVRVL